MKINNILISSIVALAISTFISCTKTEVDAIGANDKNNLTLEFDNRVGDQKLVLGRCFKNSSGEDFTVTTFNYFISNIALKRRWHGFKIPKRLFFGSSGRQQNIDGYLERRSCG